MTSVPPAGQPPIPPNTFSTALPIQPNYLSETYGNDLAWLQTFFTVFLSLTFPLWTGPHLSRLLRRLPSRDSEVSAPGNQQQQHKEKQRFMRIKKLQAITERLKLS